MSNKLTRHPTRKQFEPGRGYTKEDWDEVSDNPPMTDEELASGRPFAEVFPHLAESIKRGKANGAGNR